MLKGAETQLKHIEAKTGLSLAELHRRLDASGEATHAAQRRWLQQAFALGYGDANAVLTARQPPRAADEALEAIYAGNKAGLRPLHEALMAQLHALGAFEIAPKKAYLSLRRSKQFAMVGPATAQQIEIGLNCKTLPAHERLKPEKPGGMCQARTRIAAESQIDADLLAWLRAAYDAAA